MASEQSVWNIVESINEVSIIPPFHRAYCLHAGRLVLVRVLPRAGIVRVITKQSARQAPVLNSLSYHPVFENQDQGLHCQGTHQNSNIFIMSLNQPSESWTKTKDQGSEIK